MRLEKESCRKAEWREGFSYAERCFRKNGLDRIPGSTDKSFCIHPEAGWFCLYSLQISVVNMIGCRNNDVSAIDYIIRLSDKPVSNIGWPTGRF